MIRFFSRHAFEKQPINLSRWAVKVDTDTHNGLCIGLCLSLILKHAAKTSGPRIQHFDCLQPYCFQSFSHLRVCQCQCQTVLPAWLWLQPLATQAFSMLPWATACLLVLAHPSNLLQATKEAARQHGCTPHPRKGVWPPCNMTQGFTLESGHAVKWDCTANIHPSKTNCAE